MTICDVAIKYVKIMYEDINENKLDADYFDYMNQCLSLHLKKCPNCEGVKNND